jgi:hypothetical protein
LPDQDLSQYDIDDPAAADGTAGRLPSLFREVNDELMRFSLSSADGDGSIAVLCECGGPDCFAPLRLPAETYQLARSKPGRMVLKDGHQPDGAQIVVSVDGYVVAER